ncbi:Peptidyl-prolyl cis-trans isomerase fkbp13, chloroplastic [Stylosanthes scabra]|uniref:peptidylprolyl isomerase n=1 Tax=Stylosanthes scabra TaxID=79078 RepID=A0ABU6RW66_9FABA|nr:Peptidyl-prolyl cis-trans isomerase fkbp13, chloroplastic [Stylosanthes scabra]
MMSSVAAAYSSLGTCTWLPVHSQKRTPPPLAFSSTHHRTIATSCSYKQHLESESIHLLKRREAIGIGLGLLHSFLQPLPSSAAESDSPPCELTVAPSGLAFCDKLVGTGPQAVKGQLIKAHYVGKLENGKVFDSSYSRGKPLTFRVGVGEVIKGWDEGILGGDGIPPMLQGGKRTLKLPPQLGYGSRGAGCRGGSCVIPPDSVLLFDVEFVSKA